MNPVPFSSATQPRYLAFANGMRLVGVVEFDVDNNSFYQADTFSLTLCLSEQPVATGWAWWASQTEVEIEILAGYPSNPEAFGREDLVSLVIGDVDEIAIDPVRDEIVMSGRDLTSRFIDNKTTEQHRNLTASEIVTKLAKERGLTPVVTKTSVKVGTYYDIDKVDVADDRPEWDLLTYLAQVSQFQVYVVGRELHFQPKASPSKDAPYVVRWQPPTDAQATPVLNAVQLSMSRNLTVSRGIVVTVRSYNVKQKKGFSKVAQRARVRSATGLAAKQTNTPQKYFFTVANKSAEETQDEANRRLAEISQHEMNIRFSIPGDPALTPRTMVRLEGTGTAFDQLFYPGSVVHSVSFDGGYRTSCSAKNSSPESTVAP